MDQLGAPHLLDSLGKLWPLSLLDKYLLVHLVLVSITVMVVMILKVLSAILETWNYELDMTSSEYCKPMAEINNNLVHRRTKPSIVINSNRLPLDHTTSDHDKHNNELRSRDSEDGSTKISGGDGDKNDCDDSINNNSVRITNLERQAKLTGQDLTTPDDGISCDDDDLHVYPNGWIPIMESSCVKAASIKRAIIFGKDVIITRSDDGGTVNVLDAYCPHLGVHIGIGGKVKRIDNESCVECPFHGWTFRASDGQCVKIPYQRVSSKATIPKQAKLHTWTSIEVDNFIYVWHHIDGQPPTWYPTSELKARDWYLVGRSCHTCNLDIRDMLENGADMNHFEGIHSDLFLFGSQLTKLGNLSHFQTYSRHHYAPDWKPILSDTGKMTHMARFKLQSWISVLGLRIFDITVHAHQIGPARVNMYYDSKWYGRGLLIMNSIPLGGRRTKYLQHVYTERTLFQCLMAKLVLYGEVKMLERDLFIWNHKKTLKNPIFIPEDKALKQFRLWYSQFYKRKRNVTIGASQHPEKSAITGKLSCSDMYDF